MRRSPILNSSVLGSRLSAFYNCWPHPIYSIICLGFFALFPSIFPSITVAIAVSLLLACVRSIFFVSFLLFVTGIFPLQSLPALLCFLYMFWPAVFLYSSLR